MNQSQYRKLSDVIAELEEGHRLPYLRLFLEAVEAEQIDAVPNESDFKIRTKVCRDLTFEAGPTFEEWHRHALRNLSLSKRRGITAHSEDVVSGQVDFKAKAKAFRQELKKRKGRSKPKAGPAKTAVTAGSGSKAKVPAAGAGEVGGGCEGEGQGQ